MLRTRNSSTQRSWIQLAVAFLLGVVLTVVLFTGPSSRTAPDTGWRKELETGISNRKLIQESSNQDKAPKKKLLAIVGVQTGFSHVGSSSGYDYPKRRAALRKTWFPASQAEADRLEAEQSILYRFVIGHSLDNRQELAVNSEMKENGACIRLPLIEDYMSLTRKTLLFLQYVYERYDAEYIMKVDDDVYLRTDRLAPIINQWTLSGSDYIGCMKTGQVFRDQNLRWFEPQNSLIGGKMYFTHAWGSIYVLSKHAAGVLATLSAAVPDGLRFFINEDVTVGGWMLAMNVTHLDDRRLCESECTPATLAVYDIPQCAGLCDAPKKLPELHADPKCHSPVLNEDGEVPNLRPFFLFQSVRPS